MAGPLDRVRVLDLTSVVMGPYATSILAEFGADVVKIEPPGGEVMRKSGPMRHADMGHFYLAINRNKRSVVLDLKREEARQVLLRMAAASDVLVYNIRPQAMERLGLGYERLREVNPRLLYVGAYGFSQKGPYAARPAYDDLIQGMVGIPWLSQQAGSDQPRYADGAGGPHGRPATGQCHCHRPVPPRAQRRASASMCPCSRHAVGQLLGALAGRQVSNRRWVLRGYQRSLARDRRPYRTKDGVRAMNPQRQTVADLLRRDRAGGGSPTTSATARITGSRTSITFGYLLDAGDTSAEWLRLFERSDIPAARMAGIEDMLADEHVQATGFVREVEHPTEGRLRVTAIPTEWSESVPQHRSHAPLPGENTREVLREFGIASDEIEALVNSGAASQAQP